MPVNKGRKINRTILRDDVYNAVLEILLTGEIAPGDPLSIDSMARLLGVSPTPVREALVQLEHTGLVTREAMRGYSVAPPLTEDQVRELMDARMVLEVASARRAVERSTRLADDLRAAHLAHGQVIQRLSLSDGHVELSAEQILEHFRADWAFHMVLIEGSGNRFFEQMAGTLGANIHRTRQSLGRGLWDATHALAEHQTILEAAQSGDPELVAKALEAHLVGVQERALKDVRGTD